MKSNMTTSLSKGPCLEYLFQKQGKYIVPFLLSAIVHFFCTSFAFTQVLTDSLQIPQAHQAEDSLAVSDSGYIPFKTIPFIGSLDRELKSRYTVTDSQMVFTDYKYLGDVLETFQGAYSKNLGSPGQLHGLTLNGMDARSIAILSDGIILNDPLTGVYDLNLYPTEQIERVEAIPGTRAFLYGINSAGGAINLVSKNYQAVTPISRIRYIQSAYDYTYFDGFVTQDVRRNLNVTLGLQHPGFGGRYRDNTYDAWNIRSKIRYNFSPDINVFVSWMYNQTRLGLNGGVDTSTASSLRYDEFLTSLRSETAYEKLTRHDVQVGIAARLFTLPENISTLTFFHSTQLREYRDENPFLSTTFSFLEQDHRSQWFGVRATQHFSFLTSGLDLGAEVQSRGVIASSVMDQHLQRFTSLWGKESISPIPETNLSLYFRFDDNEQSAHFSYGGDVTYNITSGIEAFAGYSRSFRDATLQETYWQDTVVSSYPPTGNVEIHNLFEGGVGIELDNVNLSLKYFRRVINDPATISQNIIYNPFPVVGFYYRSHQTLTINGIDGKTTLRFGSFYGEGNFQYLLMDLNEVKIRDLPEWSASGGFYFWDTLFDGHLDLKAGLRGRLFSSHDGTEYNPQAQMYVPGSYWNVNAIGVGDIVLFARLGDAEIHLIMQNFFNRSYYIVPFFPMPDRTLQFGLNWQFLN